MAILDLGPAERFVAGAVGQPGRRHFYLQLEAGGIRHSFSLEKGQVAALAARSLEVLAAQQVVPDPEAVGLILEQDLAVEAPAGDVRFRVGDMSLQFGTGDLITVSLLSVDAPEEGVQFVIAPEQLQAMAVTALEVVAAGRPTCPRCRLPEDPEGHDCPAVNGHRSR